MKTQFILYVSDQDRSTKFYQKLLSKTPLLYVKSMTEFELNSKTKLGVMPNDRIVKLFPKDIPHPEEGTGIPRCELYLSVKNVDQVYTKSLQLGAKSIHKPQQRDWGDYVGYVIDFDGHIIAFKQEL